MATAEERLQILKMIESGQITAEEGAQLLEALREEDRRREKRWPGGRGRKPRWFRVRVTDLDTGRSKVNINLPWGLINVGLRMGARFAPNDIDLEEVMEAIRSGAEGKIVDVVDEEDGERVEIFVE
ncbi:MAG: hypothetical protein D6759_12855 [Chloroflexi bacterium]|nr:MAG: hypothetical protein D6759_12855 [Chloroflexota bacterium]